MLEGVIWFSFWLGLVEISVLVNSGLYKYNVIECQGWYFSFTPIFQGFGFRFEKLSFSFVLVLKIEFNPPLIIGLIFLSKWLHVNRSRTSQRTKLDFTSVFLVSRKKRGPRINVKWKRDAANCNRIHEKLFFRRRPSSFLDASRVYFSCHVCYSSLLSCETI